MAPKPARPDYWANETGGLLVPAIRRYLNGQPLSDHDVILIRTYIQQWIGSQVWDNNPHMDAGREQLARLRDLARFLTDRKAITAWIAMAVDFGVDPL